MAVACGLLSYAIVGCAGPLELDTQSFALARAQDDVVENEASFGDVTNAPADAMNANVVVEDGLPRNRRGLARRKRWDRMHAARFDPARARLDLIALKVADGAGVRIRDGLPTVIAEAATEEDDDRLQWMGLRRVDSDAHVASLRATLQSIQGATVVPFIRREREAQIVAERATHERERGQEYEDLTSIFFVRLPEANEAATRAVLARLRANPLVEYAYVQPIGEGPRTTPGCTDQLPGVTNTTGILGMSYQGAPPTGTSFLQTGLASQRTAGVDVAFARSTLGGNGMDTTLVDVENGFNFDHESLPNVNQVGFGAINAGDEHGTAVLGVAVGCSALAGPGAAGPPGIAPSAVAEFSPTGFAFPPFYSPSLAISNADHAGVDVILIEVHLPNYDLPNGCYTCPNALSCVDWVPVETYAIDHASIRAAVANGRIVVEAAGNGQRDLDVYPGLARFPANDPRNSGAIMVGGIAPIADIDGHFPTACGSIVGSNIGSRVDISAWYGSVDTLGYGSLNAAGGMPFAGLRFNSSNSNDVNQWYTAGFAGTSSASAIVAGAMLSTLGMFRGWTGNSNASSAGLADLVIRTARKQAPGAISKAGPTLQLGMTAAVFRERMVGDGADTTNITDVISATAVTTSNGVSVIATARTNTGTYAHNMLRGGAWYGWTNFPQWNTGGANGGVLRDLQVRQTTYPWDTQIEAVAIDNLDRPVVSRMSDINPQVGGVSAFSAWSVASPALMGPVSHVTGIDFISGYHHIFGVSTTGQLRMIYRTYYNGTYNGGALNLPTPITIGSKIVAIPTGPTQLELYAISTGGVLHRAYFNGSFWNGWWPVPGGAGAINLAATKISASQIAIVAGWALGSTMFVLDLPTGTYTTQFLSTGQPAALELVNLNDGAGSTRLITTDAVLGRVSTRLIYQNGPLNSQGFIWYTSTSSPTNLAATPWRDQLGITMSAASGRAFFRVIDTRFPNW